MAQKGGPCLRGHRVRPLRRFASALPEGEPLAGRITFHWTPEARQDAKGRALLAGAAASGQRSLSSCRWPRQRSTAVSEILCFARPDESRPTCQWLPLWGNGDDRRQWRKQGGAVGAAASRMRAAAKQTLGAATRPWRGACDETERARALMAEPPHSDGQARLCTTSQSHSVRQLPY